jgi:hypothetical protein
MLKIPIQNKIAFLSLRKVFPTKFTQNVHFVGTTFSFWDGRKTPLRVSSFSKFSVGGPETPSLGKELALMTRASPLVPQQKIPTYGPDLSEPGPGYHYGIIIGSLGSGQRQHRRWWKWEHFSHNDSKYSIGLPDAYGNFIVTNWAQLAWTHGNSIMNVRLKGYIEV